MAQYRSHTPDTLVYMENHLQTFHQTKNIFLEFHTSKATRAEANRQGRDLRELMVNPRANEASHNTAVKGRGQVNQGRLERANQQADLIRRENHFNLSRYTP